MQGITEDQGFGENMAPGVIARPEFRGRLGFAGHWGVQFYRQRKSGVYALFDEDEFDNLVVDEGISHALALVLERSVSPAESAVSTWYMLLTDGSPTIAATDTAAGITASPGNAWAEVTTYAEANRPAWTDGGESSKSIDNSASKARFTMSGSATVGGAGLVSTNTKGGGTGILYAAGAFSGGNRSLQNTDLVDITGTFTGSSS